MVIQTHPLKPEAKIVKFNPKYDDTSVRLAELQLGVKQSVALKVAAAKKELPQPIQNQQRLLEFNTSSDSNFIKLSAPHLDDQKLAAAQDLETALFEKAMIEDIMQRYQAAQNMDASLDTDDVDLAQTQLQTYIVEALTAKAKQDDRVLLPAAATAIATNMMQQLDVAELPLILAELQAQNQAKIDGLVEQTLNPALAHPTSGPIGPTGPTSTEPAVAGKDLNEGALLKTADAELTPAQKQGKITLSTKVTTKLKVSRGGGFDGRALLTDLKNNKTDIAPDTVDVVKQKAAQEIGKHAAQDLTNRFDPTTQQKFDQVKQVIDQMVCFENANGTTLTVAQQNEANLHRDILAAEVVKGTPKQLSRVAPAA